ncbi:hypothetical protein MMC12_002335 [Toensbergia leucococca]|nr:hypothetical protein [Toensbergia leucococca]
MHSLHHLGLRIEDVEHVPERLFGNHGRDLERRFSPATVETMQTASDIMDDIDNFLSHFTQDLNTIHEQQDSLDEDTSEDSRDLWDYLFSDSSRASSLVAEPTYEEAGLSKVTGLSRSDFYAHQDMLMNYQSGSTLDHGISHGQLIQELQSSYHRCGVWKFPVKKIWSRVWS